MTRTELADLMVPRIAGASEPAARSFEKHGYFIVDDLLPADIAGQIATAFPSPFVMMLRKSMRELKYVSAQMDRHPPILEESVYAFQDKRVVSAIAGITRLQAVEPDEHLYAGGISSMDRGHYLRPHIDNSHDMDRARYRVLNLLYYVTPGWREDHGGSLELWPNGPDAQPLAIHSKFNRLLVIATNRQSWHSVNRISGVAPAPRTCVSNYYFSPISPEGADYFHVTSFRGRPEEPLTDIVLRADAAARSLLRKLRSKGLIPTRHFYKR
jgi:Rps23 Pro-64 3,4-dihydroxylase Tpa1-like proline 4-hydroxylase